MEGSDIEKTFKTITEEKVMKRKKKNSETPKKISEHKNGFVKSDIPKKLKLMPKDSNVSKEFEKSETLDLSNEPEKLSNDTKFTQFYINGYCVRNNVTEQYYAQDQSGNEMYRKDDKNDEIYAQKTIQVDGSTHAVQFPAVRNGQFIYIKDEEGKPKYPIDLNTGEIIFPRNDETNEEMYPLDDQGKEFYPKNKLGQELYRSDAQGNNVPIKSTYAKDADGTQLYPKKSNKDEFYILVENREIPAFRKENGNLIGYYAKKRNGDEFYPRLFLDK